MKKPLQCLYLRAEDIRKVPRGWSIGQVKQITETLNTGKLYDEKSVSDEGQIPVVNQSASEYHGFHSEEPGVVASEQTPVSTFANHTCAMRLMKKPFSCIQNIFPRVGKEGVADTVFVHYSTLGRVSISGYKGHHPLYRDSWIPLPPLDLQRKIGGIMLAYDNLIENNLERISKLEEVARSFYEEWFIRMRFPGRERTKIDSGIPSGWKPVLLGEICEEIKAKVLPEALTANTPYIGLEHMPRRSISLSEWGNSDSVTSTKHAFSQGDILFGKIRPYFHKVGVAFIDGVASSDAIVIRPISEPLHSLVLMTVSSDRFVAEASQTMKEGSKMPRADWKLMMRYPIALPPQALLEEFSNTITSIVQQLRTLALLNNKLRAARDLLLPRLMSGEIAV
jgi:hypothetical protein